MEQSRYRGSNAVNAELSMLYWKIGQRIRKPLLKEKRAAYGEEIVSRLSAQLVPEYGEGFSRRNLFRMIRFSEVSPMGKRKKHKSTPTGPTSHWKSAIN